MKKTHVLKSIVTAILILFVCIGPMSEIFIPSMTVRAADKVTEYSASRKRKLEYNYPDAAKVAKVPKKYFYTPGTYSSLGDEGDYKYGYYIHTIHSGSGPTTDCYVSDYIFWKYVISDPGSEGNYVASLEIVEVDNRGTKIRANSIGKKKYAPIVSIDLTNHGSNRNPDTIKSARIQCLGDTKKSNVKDMVATVMGFSNVKLNAKLSTILNLSLKHMDREMEKTATGLKLSIQGTNYEKYRVLKKIEAGATGKIKYKKKGAGVTIDATTSCKKSETPKAIFIKDKEERCARVDYEFVVLNNYDEVVLSCYNPFFRRYSRSN